MSPPGASEPQATSFPANETTASTCASWRVDDGGAWRERNRTRYLELMKPVVEMARKGLGGCVFTEAQDQYWEFMGLMTFDRAVVKFDFDFLHSVHAEIYAAARAGAAGAD